MIVKELIEQLQRYNQEAHVTFVAGTISDDETYTTLETREIEMVAQFDADDGDTSPHVQIMDLVAATAILDG